MKKMLVWTLILAMMASMFVGCGNKAEEAPAEEAVKEEAVVEDAVEDAEDAAEAAVATLTNEGEFGYKEGYENGTTVDIAKDYYDFFGIDCTLKLSSPGGWALLEDAPVAKPVANGDYTVALAMYFTLDDVAKAIVETIQAVCDEAGVELLIHDANNDQVKQNEAIENWILEGVDAIIAYPADFYAIETALDKCIEAGIPVIAGNPPMAGEVVSCSLLANDDIGRETGEMMCKALLERQDKVEGKIIYGTLPTFHPNAVTRLYGFQEVVDKYAAETGGTVEYIEVTGLTQEDFYTKYQDALTANPDAVMLWGVMSSTVIGMNEAAKAMNLRPVIGGVDLDRAILAGIYNGEIDCTVGYNSVASAPWTINMVIDYLNGATIPAVRQSPIIPIDKTNCEEEMVANYGITIEEYLSGATE